MSYLPLAGTTYSWIHQAPLTDSLRSLAELGFRDVELTTAAPHLTSGAYGPAERHELIRTMRGLGLETLSVNPGFLDINLISPHREFQALSERMILGEIELAADLGARYVVVIPGRRHQLSPLPIEACRWILDSAIDRLLTREVELDVTITLETSPSTYLGSASDLMEVVNSFDSDNLGITYDAANALAIEDPAEGVKRVGDRLKLAHISDTTKARWAHDAIGTGEVDFASFAQALRDMGFSGKTVYELIDMRPPDEHLAKDLSKLKAAGWSPAG